MEISAEPQHESSQPASRPVARSRPADDLHPATLLDRMREGLALLDREWRYTFVNEPAARMLGCRPADLVGSVIWEVLPAARSSQFHTALHRAVETGEPVRFDEFYPEPVNRWFDCHAYPSEHGLSIYFNDITERHQAVETARESERVARLGISVARLGLAEIDYVRNLNHLSAEAARLFGIADQAVTVPQERVHATFFEEDCPELERRIASCMEPGGSGWFDMDHRVVWPDGSIHWLRVRKQVYFTGEGADRRPRRAMLAALDITVKMNALEQVRASEQRFRTLAESLPQLIWEANDQGVKLYCNPRYLSYSGHASLQALDRDWERYIHPDDRERTGELWRRSLKTGDPYVAEYRLRRQDGSYRHFIAHALPLRNGKGEIERWLGSSTDIHEQKLAEEALRRSEMVTVAHKLAASVAHEINNPLSAVMNLLYLIGGSNALDATTRGYLELAEEELARVRDVTVQSLRFHRQSMGAEPTRIDNLLETLLTLYQRRIGAARLRIVRDFSDVEPLLCLGGDLRQAIGNVLGNAVDASPHGGSVTLRLRESRDWKSRRQRGLRITIADRGPGIPNDHRTRIFQAFFSTKGITSTGLGLWITQDLIAKCGGTISVASSTRPGRSGTVFSIFLPRIEKP